MQEFKFRGKTLEELKEMDVNEFIEMLPSREKRSLKRGFSERHKKLLKKIDLFLQGKYKKPIKTHCRDMIVLPKMVGMTIYVHKGSTFEPVKIEPESVGFRLGYFVLTRKKVEHSAPGVGATKSSSSASVK